MRNKVTEIDIVSPRVNKLIARYIMDWETDTWVEYFDPWSSDEQALHIMETEYPVATMSKFDESARHGERFHIEFYESFNDYETCNTAGIGIANKFSEAVCKGMLGIIAGNTDQFEIVTESKKTNL